MVEFDIAHDSIGGFIQAINDVIESRDTLVVIRFRGPGGGNPQLLFTFGSDADRAAVRLTLIADGFDPTAVDHYFNR